MRQIALLRGINIGPHNRIAMPALRAALTGAGRQDVRTYVQSGNVVLDSDASPEALAADCRRLIAEHFDLSIHVVTRTRDELASVVRRNPIPAGADEPKRYQVLFMEAAPGEATVARLHGLALDSERLAAHGRELYAWHPEGIARSKLATAMAARSLGVVATARNWTTVCTLLQMADE